MFKLIEPIIKTGMLCALIMLIDFNCIQINEPVVPIEVFKKEAYDNETKSMVSFDIGRKGLSIIANWEIGSYESSVNATIYIKERIQDEKVDTALSKGDVDNVVNVNFDKLSTLKNQLSVFYTVMNKNKDTIENRITWFDYENKVNLHLDKIEIPYFKLFYWQMEVIIKSDTLRLPESPGLWYFKKLETQ